MNIHRIHRRSILRVGGAGMLGLTMPRLLRGGEQSSLKPRAKSVIFLFQWGGPSQLDTFDMKPGAPDTVRSPYRPIASSAPGIEVCELLPEMAKRMHHVSLIRTMTHTMKNHASAGYYALSGHQPPSDDQRLRDSLDLYPAYGSVVDHLAPNTNGMPTSVALFVGTRRVILSFSNEITNSSSEIPAISCSSIETILPTPCAG